jgi:hypothetical protein
LSFDKNKVEKPHKTISLEISILCIGTVCTVSSFPRNRYEYCTVSAMSQLGLPKTLLISFDDTKLLIFLYLILVKYMKNYLKISKSTCAMGLFFLTDLRKCILDNLLPTLAGKLSFFVFLRKDIVQPP